MAHHSFCQHRRCRTYLSWPKHYVVHTTSIRSKSFSLCHLLDPLATPVTRCHGRLVGGTYGFWSRSAARDLSEGSPCLHRRCHVLIRGAPCVGPSTGWPPKWSSPPPMAMPFSDTPEPQDCRLSAVPAVPLMKNTARMHLRHGTCSKNARAPPPQLTTQTPQRPQGQQQRQLHGRPG